MQGHEVLFNETVVIAQFGFYSACVVREALEIQIEPEGSRDSVK